MRPPASDPARPARPRVVALVPLRTLGDGKTRLSDASGSVGLTSDERAGLAAAMLADVALALRAAGVPRTVVAATGPAAAAAAGALGLDVILDPPGDGGLNQALDGAARRLGAVETLLTVAADLPRLRPDDVVALLERGGAVTVAPTDDGGTGGLVRRPPSVIASAYGPSSASRHLAMAEQAGVSASSVDLPGFRHDVDTWEDLRALLDGPVGPATGRFLARVEDRLRSAS